MVKAFHHEVSKGVIDVVCNQDQMGVTAWAPAALDPAFRSMVYDDR